MKQNKIFRQSLRSEILNRRTPISLLILYSRFYQWQSNQLYKTHSIEFTPNQQCSCCWPYHSPISMSRHLVTSSHSTRDIAYTSICFSDDSQSRKFTAQSKISGAMYRTVPTYTRIAFINIRRIWLPWQHSNPNTVVNLYDECNILCQTVQLTVIFLYEYTSQNMAVSGTSLSTCCVDHHGLVITDVVLTACQPNSLDELNPQTNPVTPHTNHLHLSTSRLPHVLPRRSLLLWIHEFSWRSPYRQWRRSYRLLSEYYDCWCLGER